MIVFLLIGIIALIAAGLSFASLIATANVFASLKEARSRVEELAEWNSEQHAWSRQYQGSLLESLSRHFGLLPEPSQVERIVTEAAADGTLARLIAEAKEAS